MADANNTSIPENSVQILVDCLKGNTLADQLWPSISMVPNTLRDVNPAAFNPQVVSIGPLHHDAKNLEAGERLKKTCVSNLLVHFDCNIEQTIQECLNKVNESIDKIRECYAGMKDYTDNELARIMVMDGCFILSYLVSPRIIRDLHSWNTISNDLLLVENQIPFIVLNDIFKCTILKKIPRVSLINIIILKLCNNTFFFEREHTNPNISERSTHHDHILGILHKYYKPASPIRATSSSSSICTVVELEMAGVSFKPNEDENWAMEIKFEWLKFSWFPWFWVKPTLKLPILKIYDNTEVYLRNIIAYEQTSQDDRYFSSFMSAIDHLVNKGGDIAKLVESGVIINRFGSHKQAAEMINNICKHVIVDKTYYSEQWQQLETYYNCYWPRHIARLRLTYFNSPWNIIALFAGIFLFTLTLLQTYFTINPRK